MAEGHKGKTPFVGPRHLPKIWAERQKQPLRFYEILKNENNTNSLQHVFFINEFLAFSGKQIHFRKNILGEVYKNLLLSTKDSLWNDHLCKERQLAERHHVKMI